MNRAWPVRAERAAARLKHIAYVLRAILALNVLVALAKLLYGYRSGAIAIAADGFHSLLDAASNVIGLVGIGAAQRPPDSNHPYGHRKYETFAALGIAMMMFVGCYGIATAALERVRSPRLPDVTAQGFAVLALTLAINVVVVVIERREGKRLTSELLLSDAAHTGSDVLASLLVLASFVAIRAGWMWADVIAAALIVGLILKAGIAILQGTLSTLSDERRLPPAEVEAAALEEPGVLEVHNVRSRGPGDDIHLDLHILLDPATALADAHALGHRVERRLRERWAGLTDVIVHVEPALDAERAHERVGGGLKAEG
ncbi:MAG: cation transporter [Candidatus Eisenbacteria bacterium]|uniref:Cation transporter n=1 Tax=Eiseniibacteriota bacterium TaxID=2212470 RepID=A0A538TLE8_UNCEI|nr:MAG: cation transporter [Candidatus Eisenbacteria bacterium]